MVCGCLIRNMLIEITSKFHKNGQAKKSKGKQKKEVLCTYWTRAGRLQIATLEILKIGLRIKYSRVPKW